MAKIANKARVAGGVEFTFADGEKLVAKLSEFSKEIVEQLAVHGLAQKLGDSYSGITSVSEAQDAAERVLGNLRKGVFNASGGSGSGGGMVAEAVARIKNISIEMAQAGIDKLDDEQFESLKKNQKVKDMVKIIQGERAAKRLTEEDDLDFPV